MKPTKTFSVLWNTFRKYRWHIGVLTVLGFLGAILEGIGINAIIPLLSFLSSNGQPTDVISRTIEALFRLIHLSFTFRNLLGLIVALFLLRAASVVLFGYVRGWIVADFTNNESSDMLRRIFFASWPFLLKQKLGTVQTTAIRDVQQSGRLLESLSQAIQSFTGFFMYVLVAINISPLLTLCTAVGGLLLVGVVRPFLLRIRTIGGQLTGTEKYISHFLSEHIIGMKSLKVMSGEERALERASSHLDSLRDLQVRSTFFKTLSSSFFQPFSLVFVIVLFSIMYKSSSFSLVSFAAALYLIQKIFTYLESGQTSLAGIEELVPYAQNMSAFKETLGTHREPQAQGDKPFNFAKTLAFEHVSFSYIENRLVLTDLSFTIVRGQTVAFIGPSGAGKTSVADIILRLFEPTLGRITLDGVAIQDISLESWRKNIGYVSQDVFMFNGSVEENIRFYRAELTKEEIVTATKEANIYDFIISLPEGFDTVVGDRGVMLSGGQRQRIALARALAGNPALLVLDEATSALDTESERLIQEAIGKLHGQVTVFIIAHRLSTVEHADVIFVLDDGRIIESGSPEALLKTPASYFARHSAGR
ncbi:MAG: ABC transporter ATP-binding protein [Minisyncoccia bacterium]|jgi:subfamily B ATP-binding cassette protein MsbA